MAFAVVDQPIEAKPGGTLHDRPGAVTENFFIPSECVVFTEMPAQPRAAQTERQPATSRGWFHDQRRITDSQERRNSLNSAEKVKIPGPCPQPPAGIIEKETTTDGRRWTQIKILPAEDANSNKLHPVLQKLPDYGSLYLTTNLCSSV